MGTRSLTVVMSMWDKDAIQAVIFRHWDGYPSGHGADLAGYLKDGCVGNGKTSDDPEKYFNGTGRLASYIAHRMWEDGHDPSIERFSDSIPDIGQDYAYVICPVETRPNDSPTFWGPKKELENFTIEVIDWWGSDHTKNKIIFKGTPAEMLTWIENGADTE